MALWTVTSRNREHWYEAPRIHYAAGKVPGWVAAVYARGRTRSNRSARGHGASATAVLQRERGKGDCGRLRPHLSERRKRAGCEGSRGDHLHRSSAGGPLRPGSASLYERPFRRIWPRAWLPSEGEPAGNLPRRLAAAR